MSGDPFLTGEQAAALLDILTHHGTYAEIEAFKTPQGVTGFGHPFRRETRVPTGPPSRGGSRSRTTTPSGSVPSTPRARTPVSFFWSRGGDKKKDVAGEVGLMTEVERGIGDGDGDQEGRGGEQESRTPLLQMLLARLVLPFPGVGELSGDFWGMSVQGLLARFAEAGLSESYDQGAMGTRKTLACGAGSVIEMLTRGVLSGVKERTAANETMEMKKRVTESGNNTDKDEPAKDTPRRHAQEEIAEDEEDEEEEREEEHEAGKRRQVKKRDGRHGPLMGEYDFWTAEGLERAWDDCLQEYAYGDLVDELFDHFSRTQDIEGHSPAVRGTVDYAIVHIATFAHQIFIQSPEGQYLIKLLESINNLVPYRMITQTLRVGNAAVMINGMVRLLLTKLSMTSLTNWVGLTANADDGMNLLQRIIWIVLTYDASEFRKSADKIEKAREGGEEDKLPEEVLQAIREHVAKSWEEHDAARKTSLARGQSVIAAILESAGKDAQLVSGLSKSQHAQCLAYYSALLSSRDREAIINVLCRQPPDLFTQILKDVIAAFDPLIRSVHTRIDLREHLESFQQFLSEFIRVSKPRKPEKGSSSSSSSSSSSASSSNSDASGSLRANTEGGKPPSPDPGEVKVSVEDYTRLLRRNKGLLFKWIHAVAKECPDVWADMRVWAKAVAVQFRERAAAPRETYTNTTTDPDTKTSDTYRDKRSRDGPLKDMHGFLEGLFLSLDEGAQSEVLAAIDAHAIYLSDITLQSRQRLQRILTKSGPLAPEARSKKCRATTPARDGGDSKKGTASKYMVDDDDSPDMCGPGVYLFRWQDLLDSTPITPAELCGPPRRGIDVKYTMTMGKLGLGGMVIGAEEGRAAQGPGREAPDVSVVVGALADKFRSAIWERSKTWGGPE